MQGIKKKKAEALSFVSIMQKCHFKNGNFWNKNYITKNFYNLLYLWGLRKHLYKKKKWPVYKSFLGNVMIFAFY